MPAKRQRCIGKTVRISVRKIHKKRNSGIFKSGNPEKRAAAIVKAVTNFTDAKLLAELSEDLGEAMVGINEKEIELLMAQRGE